MWKSFTQIVQTKQLIFQVLETTFSGEYNYTLLYSLNVLKNIFKEKLDLCNYIV